VNRAGFGYISHMTDEGKVDPINQPVMHVEQAVQALRDAWTRAVEMANSSQEDRLGQSSGSSNRGS
jgi:hypothetical protein